MKRMIGIALACVLLLCGCGAEPAEEPQTDLPETIPVVVPIGERTEEGVKVTIHAGLLGVNTEYLTAEQKADGFISGERNEDDSVTYLIDSAKYDAFVEKDYQKTCTSIDETVKGNFPSVTGVSYEKDLSAVTLTVMRDTYLYSVDALAVFAVGTLVITHQAYDLDAVGTCTITVLDENGEQISQNVYPDELVL